MLQTGANPVAAARRFAEKGAGGDADVSLAIESQLAAPMSMTMMGGGVTSNSTAFGSSAAFNTTAGYGREEIGSSLESNVYTMFVDDAGVYYRDLSKYRHHSFAAAIEAKQELRSWCVSFAMNSTVH
jgi:hypothetical protein